jgi:2-methylisocitrate lyase-like PEP mutase family enzyme
VGDRASRPTQAEKAERFRALHGGAAFAMPNPWDAGSARTLEALGFEALATTSAGLRDIEQIRAVCEALERPVNVLARPDLSLAEVVAAGARRISAGGSLAWVANEALADAAERIRDRGDFSGLRVSRRAAEWLGD